MGVDGSGSQCRPLAERRHKRVTTLNLRSPFQKSLHVPASGRKPRLMPDTEPLSPWAVAGDFGVCCDVLYREGHLPV